MLRRKFYQKLRYYTSNFVVLVVLLICNDSNYRNKSSLSFRLMHQIFMTVEKLGRSAIDLVNIAIKISKLLVGIALSLPTSFRLPLYASRWTFERETFSVHLAWVDFFLTNQAYPNLSSINSTPSIHTFLTGGSSPGHPVYWNIPDKNISHSHCLKIELVNYFL